MSTKAIEVTTNDLLELQEAVDRNAPISEIRELLKKARFHYAGEQSLQRPVADLLLRILTKYVVNQEGE